MTETRQEQLYREAMGAEKAQRQRDAAKLTHPCCGWPRKNGHHPLCGTQKAQR